MDDSKNCVLVAKKEYTTILLYNLYPGIYQGLKSIWDDSKKTALPRRVYEEFQNRLSRVRKWNQDVIDNEYKRIVEKSKCDYLDDLIKKVFVINTQILAAINMHGQSVDTNKKIKVKVPKGDKFIHYCYKECARTFYENALLMEDRQGAITRVEQAKNMQKCYKLIIACIETTIRNMLPIESLLKDQMENEGEDATPLPQMYRNMPGYNIQDNVSKKDEASIDANINNKQETEYVYVKDNPDEKSDEKSDENAINNDKDNIESYKPLYNTENLNNNENYGSETEDKNSENDSRDDQNVKTIFLGKTKKELNRENLVDKKETKTNPFLPEFSNPFSVKTPEQVSTFNFDENSDNSMFDNAKIRNPVLDDNFGDAPNEEIPTLKRPSSVKHLDLDVFSENDELALDKPNNRYSNEKQEKSKVPPLDNFDTTNFFSDAED